MLSVHRISKINSNEKRFYSGTVGSDSGST